MKAIIKKTGYVLCVAVFFISRDKSGSEPKKFELGSLQKILDGHIVMAIAFDSKENTWIGTRTGLIRYNEKETVVYSSDNSVIPENLWILDVAVDKKDNIWIGTENGIYTIK